jgi:hypothetical protein
MSLNGYSMVAIQTEHDGSLCGCGLSGVSCELAFKRLDVPAVSAESGNDSLGSTEHVRRHVPMLLRSGDEAWYSGSDKLSELILRMAAEWTRVLLQ